MQLPTEQQCLDYFNEYKVPDNIFRHCCKVKDVAVFLAQELHGKKIQVNVEFLRCLAYLHDLCKMITIKDFGANEFHKGAFVTEEQARFWKEMQIKYQEMFEGEMAYRLFKEKYPELALALLDVSNPRNQNPSWEQLIVHYADWRVLREKVVPLSERLAYLKKRYPRTDDSWQRYEQLALAQEQKIFSHLGFTPDQLSVEIEVNQLDKSFRKNTLAVQHEQ